MAANDNLGQQFTQLAIPFGAMAEFTPVDDISGTTENPHGSNIPGPAMSTHDARQGVSPFGVGTYSTRTRIGLTDRSSTKTSLSQMVRTPLGEGVDVETRTKSGKPQTVKGTMTLEQYRAGGY